MTKNVLEDIVSHNVLIAAYPVSVIKDTLKKLSKYYDQ